MHHRAHLVGSVVLIAEAGSAQADRVAAELTERQFKIDRIAVNDRRVGEPVAVVVLVERQSSIEALRETLDQALAPTLVLAATPELLAAVLPILHTRHDLALATEAADVIAWRLRRLIEQSRCLRYAETQIDALTGLLNRRGFESQLSIVAESMAPGTTVGLLALDLDRFKVINDSFGHVGGDSVLRAVGELLPRVLSSGDAVARVGGDEFSCILVRPDTESMIRDVERVLEAISGFDVSSLLAGTTAPRLTASAGLTSVRPGVGISDLMSEADVAMYEAKGAGRNRLVVYGGPADAANRSSRDPRLRHFESSTRLAGERLVEMIALKSRRLIEAAKQEAIVDALTSLYNRRYIDAQMPVEVDCANSQGRRLSLAMIDVDNFRVVNQTYGWPTGDRVLQAFATVARASVRATDWVARYGGEEFVIVMPDTDRDSAWQVAERVREAFASTTIESVDGRRFKTTLSAGVAQAPAGVESATAFVQHASVALLWAKAAGRNRVEQAGVDGESSAMPPAAGASG